MAVPYSRTVFGGISWYGVMVACGIMLALWIAGKEEKRLKLPEDTLVDLALLVVPFGLLGARLYYALMSWENFSHDLLSIFYVWEGGLAIYGSVIAGALTVWIYSKRKKISFALLADMIAPGLLLAQAVGRWGNYFNMEAYGPQITDTRLQFFPLGVLIPGANGNTWHMATFFYESVWNFAGFITLWMIRKRQKQAGNVFCWYLLIYGSGRFIIEQLRQDSLYIGSFRASQWLSLILCLLSAAVLLYRAFSSTRQLASGALCAALWFLRWACLDHMALYAPVLLTAGIVAIWILRSSKSLHLLIVMFAFDGLGLLLSVTSIPAAGYLHAFLCSATLPGQMMALCTKDE